MTSSQRHLPVRPSVISSIAIRVAGRGSRTAACREVVEDLAGLSFGGGASLAASANDPRRRERTNARHVSTSRRGEGVSNGCASTALPAPEAFGASCGLLGRFALRAPGQSQSQRPTPNQALQRTAGFGGQFPRAAFVRPAQSRAVRPAIKPGTPRAFASRRPALTTVPGPQSLSYGSLGHLHALAKSEAAEYS